MNYILVLLACILVNNVIFNQIYGICPFLGVSKKTDQAIGMGVAVTFVMVAASAVTWPIQHYLLNGLGISYLQTIVFILVIAALVQFIEMVLKKYIPSLHRSLGVYLPLITTNCAVLGVTVDNISGSYSFVASLLTALGGGLGFLLAMILFSGVRSRYENNDITPSWKGLPITLAAAAIVSMCFKGFEGVVSIPTKSQAPELYFTAQSSSSEGNAVKDILIAVGVVVAIGVVCSGLLMLANKFMSVKEDERFPKIRACLPGANCGACGYAGCDGYAKALLEDGTPINKCIPGADDVSSALADLLGREFEDVEEQVALVRCAGDCNVATEKADYAGISSCAAAKLQFGGKKSCIYGCFGLGDCAKVCPNQAICITDGIARVDTRKCSGCGLCSRTCPQKVIEMVSDRYRVVVLCSNQDKGAEARKSCSKGCIGCKKCEKNCPTGAIKVQGNLAVIDQNLCIACKKCLDGCPAHAIIYTNLSGIHRQ